MNEKHTQQTPALELQADPSRLQSWEAMFALAGHWQSDLKFFNDELSFLNTLIDKYLVKLVEEDNASKIAPLTLALSKLEVKSRALGQKVGKHLQHIQELVENPFSHDSQTSKDAHLTLESELRDFVKEFRVTKLEIFSSTEQVLKSTKARHLLTS